MTRRSTGPARRGGARRAVPAAAALGCVARAAPVVALALALTLLSALAGPPPRAAAHGELLASDPDNLSQVARPPRQVRLTFFDAVDPQRAVVTLSVDGSVPRELVSRIEGSDVVAPVEVSPSGYNQQWYVGYRVDAYDGHPVTGVLSFVVNPDPSSPATPIPADAGATAAQPPSTAGPDSLRRRDGTRPFDLPPAVPVAVILLAVVGSVVVAARNRRRDPS